MRSSPAERSAVTVVALLLVAIVAVPAIRLVWEAFDSGTTAVRGVLTSPDTGRVIGNTVALGAVVTVLTVPLAAAIALALRRTDVPARGLLRVGVLLPVFVPQFVLGYSWTLAYGRAGFTDSLLGLYWPALLGLPGIVVVLVVNATPVAYLVIAAGLATRAGPDLERAARTSGASPRAVLRTVTLPLLRPSLAAAAVLTFVLTLESFAIPQVMAAPAGYPTLTTRIYSDLTPAGTEQALTLAVVLVLLAAVIVAPSGLAIGWRLRVEHLAQPMGAAQSRRPSWAGRAITTAIGAGLALTIGLPLVALLAIALTRSVGLPPIPENWTLDNLRSVADASTAAALARSALLAGLAATVLTVLGAIVAALERRRGRARILGTLVTFTLMLPGSTLAVAMLVAYGRWIGGSLLLILLAYLAKFWAFTHRSVAGALDGLPAADVHAARASGAGQLTAIRTVVLRRLAPVLIIGWLLVFLTALHEVTMSSLLHGPGGETFAVVVLNSQELGRTASLSVLLGLAVLLPGLALWAVLRLQRKGATRAG